MIIQLTKGYSCIVDPEDYEILSQWKWHVVFSGSIPYAVRNRRQDDDWDSCTVKMHRWLGKQMGLDLDLDVDHCDGNTMDNRRRNLRNCTRQQGNCNRGIKAGNSTGFKGVYPAKDRTGKIRAYGAKYQAKFLGYWKTAEEAHLAYVAAAAQAYGEFMPISDRVKRSTKRSSS